MGMCSHVTSHVRRGQRRDKKENRERERERGKGNAREVRSVPQPRPQRPKQTMMMAQSLRRTSAAQSRCIYFETLCSGVGDGETYERSAIEEHIRAKQVMLAAAQAELDETNGESNEAQRALENGITSPMGHGLLESLVLVPARAMRTVADDWREGTGVL
jgi:hypothetical protein